MLRHIPNFLTVYRILSVPVIICTFYMEDTKFSHILGALLFWLASVSDFLDGFLARKYNIQSNFGKILDPIADKILVVSIVLTLMKFDRVDLFPCILIISREFIISGLREYLAGIVEIPVSKLAKMKTTIQLVTFFIIILGTKGSGINGVDELGAFMLWVTAIITVYTGYSYFVSSFKYLK